MWCALRGRGCLRLADRRHDDQRDEPSGVPSVRWYFGHRNPGRFPTLEDLRAAGDLYPRPMLESVEEALRREDEGTMVEVYAAAEIRREDLAVR
jgi:hypothetical protein